MSPGELHSISTVAIATSYGLVAVVWMIGGIYNFFRSPDEQDHIWFLWPAFILFAIAAAVVNRTQSGVWRDVTVHAAWIRLLGLPVLAIATVFTLWARASLGTMWTGDPGIKVGHRLRTRGPYRLVRHPIYTGLLGMMAGATLLVGEGRWLVFLAMNIVLTEVKIYLEERLLSATFGEDYSQYRSNVPKLIPGLLVVARLVRHLNRGPSQSKLPPSALPGPLA